MLAPLFHEKVRPLRCLGLVDDLNNGCYVISVDLFNHCVQVEHRLIVAAVLRRAEHEVDFLHVEKAGEVSRRGCRF